MGSRTARRRLAVCLVAVVALAVVQVAPAETPVVQYTAADQAAARAIVLKKADLGAGWKGGPTKPEISDPSEGCPGWDPRQTDLTITGAAESEWEYAGGALSVSNTAYVLETPGMVQQDWQRTIVDPAAFRCIRKFFADASNKEARFVSAARQSLPKVGPRASRFRFVINYVEGNTKVPVLIDFVAIATGRTELTLMLTAPLKDRRAAEKFELQLARLLISRTRA